MPAIRLHKYLKERYPDTPKSTLHFWIKQALEGKGVLAHLTIFRIGRPYYVQVDEDPLVTNIAAAIEQRLKGR